MKENLDISGKNIEITIKRQLVVALDDFVLKEQRQDINENVEETLGMQHKRLKKSKRGKDKDDQ